jgi:hypothetical protein
MSDGGDAKSVYVDAERFDDHAEQFDVVVISNVEQEKYFGSHEKQFATTAKQFADTAKQIIGN